MDQKDKQRVIEGMRQAILKYFREVRIPNQELNFEKIQIRNNGKFNYLSLRMKDNKNQEITFEPCQRGYDVKAYLWLGSQVTQIGDGLCTDINPKDMKVSVIIAEAQKAANILYKKYFQKKSS